MTSTAAEVEPVLSQMHIEQTIRIRQTRVQVTMFDTITATSVEMACAAGGATCHPHVLSHICQISGLPDLVAVGRKRLVCIGWVTGSSGEFLIRTGSIVTHQAINLVFRGEVEGIVFPSIADVTTGATGVIGLDTAVEAVDDHPLSQWFSRIRMRQLPVPVFGLMDLFCCFRMTAETSPCDLRTILEPLIQNIEFRVVSGRVHLVCRGVYGSRQTKHDTAHQ
jgi:hypothetical protein